MSLRIPSERASEAVFALQTIRNVSLMFVTAAVVATLINADEGHIHFLALTTVLRDWIHAAFNL